MAKLTLSEKYGLAATAALFVMVVLNNPIVMLTLSVLGIIAGLWVVRRGEVRRASFLAFAGFVLTAVFAIISLAGAG